MPEFRTDPVTGHRVIIAPDRALRPDQADGASGPCVFCPGQEAETPPEVARLSGPGGWRARVVPNKYPAVENGPPKAGAHEVIIESARHVTTFASLSEEEVADILGLWQERLRAHRDGGRYAQVAIFKNEGAAAGASIEHVHSQVVALSGWEPGQLMRLMHLQGESCAICGDVDPGRAVAARGGYSARVPFGPRFPHEVRIAPATHRARFEEEGDGAIRALAALLLDVLGRLRAVLGWFPYNLTLQTAPFPRPGDYHWYVEILPRTSRPGGFEWGTGTFINTVSPEASAELLRRARA